MCAYDVYLQRRRECTHKLDRYLVGEPYCQEPAFLKALDDLTAQWAIASLVASVFPGFLKSYAVRYLTKFEKPRQYVQEKLYELERVKEEKQVKDGVWIPYH